MSRAIGAGALYFALVFAAGFALGSLRTLWLEPQAGALAATLIELPLILALSWLACGWVVRRWRVPASTWARLAMGAVFLMLLWAAECAVGIALMGRDWPAQWAAFTSPQGLTGIAAQIAAALFPLLRKGRA